MKTQYYTASSLDGFIATADHSLDWLFPLGNIEDTSYPSFFEGVGAIVMGSHAAMMAVAAGSVLAVGTGFAELQYDVPRPAVAASA